MMSDLVSYLDLPHRQLIPAEKIYINDKKSLKPKDLDWTTSKLTTWGRGYFQSASNDGNNEIEMLIYFETNEDSLQTTFSLRMTRASSRKQLSCPQRIFVCFMQIATENYVTS